MEELKSKFEILPEEEKLQFLTSIMPTICKQFKENPQKMMMIMMPFCKDMMKDCNIDMSQMMSMMNK